MALKIGKIAWVGLAMLGACQPAAEKPGPQTVVRVRDSGGDWRDPSAGPSTGSPQGGPGQGPSLEQILPGNPSEMRLSDIGGAIMIYYSINKAMPERLTDLESVAEAQLNFFSPVSGKLYVYVKEGLRAPGAHAPIIVYDPEPGSDGTRWCLEMEEAKPGAGMSVVARQVEEKTFELYQLGN